MSDGNPRVENAIKPEVDKLKYLVGNGSLLVLSETPDLPGRAYNFASHF